MADYAKWCKVYGKEKTEAEFCEWISKQVTKNPVVKNFHAKWKELEAWEEGDQFSVYDPNKQAMMPVNLVVRKARCVVNLLKPLVETIEAKLNIGHTVIGTPNSGEAQDIQGANVATRFIAFNDIVNDFPAKLSDLRYDLLRPGVAFVKWLWDGKRKGAKAAPMVDGKIDRAKEVDEDGEVICRIVSPYNIRVAPSATSIASSPWLIELMEVSRDIMLDTYDLSDEEAEELYATVKSKRFDGTATDANDRDDEEPTFPLRILTERSSKDYPDGRIMHTCGNKILFADENDNPDHDLGYFAFKYRRNKRNFWCHGPLFYVQDDQRHINRLTSMALEHVESWRPKMMVGQGALTRAGSLTMDAAELVEVDMTRGTPQKMDMPQLSPEVRSLREWFVSSMGNTANVHEVSDSRLPQYASRAPASLYEMMLQQENTKLDPMLLDINRTFVEMDRFRLKLMQKHYKMPRMVKIVGKNRAAAVEYFSGADLNGNYDVVVETGASLNQSPSLTVKTIMELWKDNVLDESFRGKILRILNLGTAEQELREDVADMEKAIRENQAFLDDYYEIEINSANNPDAKPFEKGGVFFYIHDDHRLHLEQHTTLMKSEEAMSWPMKKIIALNEHIMKHLQVVMASAQTPGGPPPAPGATGTEHTPSAGDQEGTGAPSGPPPAPGEPMNVEAPPA